jgi:rod shape-determining protein MreB
VVQVSDREAKPVNVPVDTVLSVVGFPKAGMLPGILPTDADALFGQEALNYRTHLDLVWPLKDGFVSDLDVGKRLAGHLRELIDPGRQQKLWGVVGAPANATAQKQKDLRSTMVGVLDRIVIVPEPFLASMGLREDKGPMSKGSELDPTKNSLIVDIGAGTTDLCLVRGYFPTEDDQISFPKAGSFIDERLHRAIQQRYPDLNVSLVTVTQIKEQHSYVGPETRDATVKVYVDGRPQRLNFGELVHEACEALVPLIVNGIKNLLKRCDSDSTEKILQNIIVTGGGSQIDGISERIQQLLRADGYDEAVTQTPADYKRLVARGALKIAQSVRDDQWQMPF